MAEEVAPIPTRGDAPERAEMPNSFFGKLFYMLGPLLLFLIIGGGISYAIAHFKFGTIEKEIEKRASAAETARQDLSDQLEAAKKSMKEEKQTVVVLTEKVEKLRGEKEDLASGLKSAIASLETVSTTLQNTSSALDDYKESNNETNQTQNNSISENTRNIQYLKQKVSERFDKITAEIGQMKHVDVMLKGEYVALRTDLKTTMERGNVTESELNKLAERSKIFQLRVLTARAKEAEEAAREGDLKKLLVKLGEQ